MRSSGWLATALVSLASLTAAMPRIPAMPKQPAIQWQPEADGPHARAGLVEYFFDQLLDHTNPSLGTFKQRYWFSEKYYKPGGPIILFNAGEEDASQYTGYLQNVTITGAIGYATGGATIVMEHRYWGKSIPFADYSTANMKYFTIHNAVQDYAYFAQNVALPWASGAKVTPPPTTAWILNGGSYPGVLAAYVKQTFPDLFYASYATSAPVQAIYDFFGYFVPVAAGAPQNCSTDMKRVITHWDKVMTQGKPAEKRKLMTLFGFGNVTHADDASSGLEEAPWSWQALGPAVGAHQQFFDFCDMLETRHGVTAGPDGFGVEYATRQWAQWQTALNKQLCGADFDNDNCWGTYDPTSASYTNIAPTNTYRPWISLSSTQIAFWQDGNPTAPSIVSKLVNPAYWERQCPLWFPAENGVSVPAKAPVDTLNPVYGGWDMSVDRLLFVNGEFDPWRSGTVSSLLPNAPARKSTEMQPILLVKTGVHCWDMITSTAMANPNTRVVFNEVVATMVKWMDEWHAARA
ncbi:unnamed protein product [Mycena citricolor]|uniref:Uncharacterized protein n=1 Tax=Mycena citricolor TaxID=2018698 RepID=A0AAD2Q2H2_9AGAR|nr:unnamed protein product [Mycena citricolor]